jgi:hypothetical protein
MKKLLLLGMVLAVAYLGAVETGWVKHNGHNYH